jgi:uncharacterized protein with GYD domain
MLEWEASGRGSTWGGKRHAHLRHAYEVHRKRDSPRQGHGQARDAFWSRAKNHGATVKDMIWVQGAHDIVVIFEAPDDETASIVILSADELGTVRTETMRGFTAAEMEKLLAKVD